MKDIYIRYLLKKNFSRYVNFSRSYGYFYKKKPEKYQNFPISKILIFSDTFPSYGGRGKNEGSKS